MSVTSRLMKLGSWMIRVEGLDAENFDRYDHVVITRSRIDVRQLADADILAQSVHTGIVTKRRTSDDNKIELSGPGLEAWLADSDNKGFVFEIGREYQSDTFADVLNRSGSTPYGLLRDDNGAFVSIQAGTINSVAGTYTGTHKYQSQREAIRYVCDVFGAEYRVNPDGTIDAGAEADLFTTTPTAVIARPSGSDPAYEGIVGDLETEIDVEDYTTRVVLLAEGEGDAIATGAANAVSVPYKDLFGNEIKRVRMVNESETSGGNAAARAQLHLNRFSSERKALTLSSDEYEIDGSFNVGDTIYVFDPEQGLEDSANQIVFRGRRITPTAIRVLGITWPITHGMGVYHRDKDGNWTDLTQHVEYETSGTTFEVGSNPRRVTDSGEPATGRINNPDASDPAVPDAPAHANTPWGTSNYVDGEGRTRSQVIVEWSEPLNTDGSTITDGSHYVVRWRRSGQTDYQTTSVPWGTTSFLLQDLAPGVTYEISVAAFDFGNRSNGYAADESITASADTIPPSQPAAPSVAGNPLEIQVTHDLGKNSGGTFNLEADLDHLNVYVGNAPTFTPATSNLAGKLPANIGHLNLGIQVVGSFQYPDTITRYVKVTAVDKAGNESTPSPASSVSATLIDTAHITDAAITTAKINDLAVTTAKINDLAVTTAKINDLAVTTAKIALLAVDTAQIADAAIETAKINDLAVTTAKIALLAVDTAQIADAAIETAKINNLAVTTGKINDLAVTTAKIDALAVTNAKINDLKVDKLTGGTISTTEITVSSTLTLGSSGVIRTASSGERIEIQESNNDRIIFYSGAVNEVSAGFIQVQDDIGFPKIRFQGPDNTTFIEFATVQRTLRLVGDFNAYLQAGQTTPTRVHVVHNNPTYQVKIEVDGTLVLDMIDTGIYGKVRYRNVDGSAGSPAYSFENDGNTGFYRNAADSVVVTAGSEPRMSWALQGGTGTGVYIHQDLTDVGNHETLRADRTGGGSALVEIGYYSSWETDPETGKKAKTDIRRLRESPLWRSEWFHQLDPIDFERVSTGQREFSFRLEDWKDLDDNLRYLTTKGDSWGYSPDENALIAVTVLEVQDNRRALDQLRERVKALEDAGRHGTMAA